MAIWCIGAFDACSPQTQKLRAIVGPTFCNAVQLWRLFFVSMSCAELWCPSFLSAWLHSSGFLVIAKYSSRIWCRSQLVYLPHLEAEKKILIFSARTFTNTAILISYIGVKLGFIPKWKFRTWKRRPSKGSNSSPSPWPKWPRWRLRSFQCFPLVDIGHR